MLATVAIVGRPNVGKSTLFNRFVGARMAIESQIAGTTRDRIYHDVYFEDMPALLVDTGGLELGKPGTDIEANVQEQSRIAIDGADLIFFVVDVREELTSEDFHAADILRKSKKNVILIANKCDNPNFEERKYNLFELGFGEPVAVTALHSFGMEELESRTAKELKKMGFEPKKIEDLGQKGRIRIAFLGRPNVGKSMMINALFGKKMVVVSSEPGTTRDASEIPFEYKDQKFILVDTAGIRRSGSVESGIEKFSVLRSMGAVDSSDICVLMIDGEEGVTNQDCHVSEYILEKKKGLMLAVNKIDLYKGKEREDREHMLVHELREKMAYLPWAPVVFTSGLERRNIFQLLELAGEIYEERKKIVPSNDLAVWLGEALDKHPLGSGPGKRSFHILSVKQDGSEPPVFVFNCRYPEAMHFSYGRYLENDLRQNFGFLGTAIRLIFKRIGEGSKKRAKDPLEDEPNDCEQ
ncbi:MAG: ribosome biogenesis GTPase Der [Candidatus Gracilibacteria bacterium]